MGCAWGAVDDLMPQYRSGLLHSASALLVTYYGPLDYIREWHLDYLVIILAFIVLTDDVYYIHIGVDEPLAWHFI